MATPNSVGAQLLVNFHVIHSFSPSLFSHIFTMSANVPAILLPHSTWRQCRESVRKKIMSSDKKCPGLERHTVPCAPSPPRKSPKIGDATKLRPCKGGPTFQSSQGVTRSTQCWPSICHRMLALVTDQPRNTDVPKVRTARSHRPLEEEAVLIHLDSWTVIVAMY